MLLKQAKKTQKRKVETFESIAFPLMELDQLPLPFYETKTEVFSLDQVEFSEVSDSFSKEFESIIEEVFSDKYEQYTYDQTSSVYEQATLDEKNNRDINEQEMEEHIPIENLPQSPLFNCELEENSFLADYYREDSLPTEQTDIGSFSREHSTNDYKKIATPEVVTKRVLKGDLTKEPVLEIADDNNNIGENEEKNEDKSTKVSKSWKRYINLLEKYPIYTKDDILKQELALQKLKERIYSEKISKGTRVAKNSFLTLVVGPYYLGKFGYKLCLRNLAKFSIAHLEEFKDVDYQELLKYAKLQSLNLKEDDLSLHDKHYKKWLETDGSVTQIPSICYRNLGNDTGSLFPASTNYPKTYSTHSRKTY